MKTRRQKKREVLKWIKERTTPGEPEPYYVTDNCVVQYYCDRGPYPTIEEFWDKYVRPRTIKELIELAKMEKEQEEAIKKIHAKWEAEERKKKREEDLDFTRLTNVKPDDAVYYEVLPDDGQLYYKTDRGYTLVK